MPLGTRQNNDFTQFTMDVWNDKIFYQEKEFPAGFMAMSILNIPEEELPELIQAGGAPTFLFPVVVQGSDEEAAAVFPQLRERILYLTELLWKYPPFCYNDYEKEMRLTDFYTYDLMNGLHHGHAPSQCQGCGKYFLTTNGHIPKYCDGVAPQDSRYTCRQYGAMMHQKEQNKQHPVYRLFNTRTDTIRKHHQRGKISDDLRREALYLAGSYRDKALMDNDYAADGYARDMELEHIYAEAEKRLK